MSAWTMHRTLTRVKRGSMKKAQNRLLDYSLKVNNQWDWAMCFAVFFTKKEQKTIEKKTFYLLV